MSRHEINLYITPEMDKINHTIRQRNKIKRGKRRDVRIFELLMSPGPVSLLV